MSENGIGAAKTKAKLPMIRHHKNDLGLLYPPRELKNAPPERTPNIGADRQVIEK
jgi:hypothetical protein